MAGFDPVGDFVQAIKVCQQIVQECTASVARIEQIEAVHSALQSKLKAACESDIQKRTVVQRQKIKVLEGEAAERIARTEILAACHQFDGSLKKFITITQINFVSEQVTYSSKWEDVVGTRDSDQLILREILYPPRATKTKVRSQAYKQMLAAKEKISNGIGRMNERHSALTNSSTLVQFLLLPFFLHEREQRRVAAANLLPHLIHFGECCCVWATSEKADPLILDLDGFVDGSAANEYNKQLKAFRDEINRTVAKTQQQMQKEEDSANKNIIAEISRVKQQGDVAVAIIMQTKGALVAHPIGAPWASSLWQNISFPTRAHHTVRLGTVRELLSFNGGNWMPTRLPQFVEIGKQLRQALQGFPAMVEFGAARGTYLCYTNAAENSGIANVLYRFLLQMPPGKVRLTLFDPVGLGQGFADFLPLKDHDDELVDGQVWSEERHIEERLQKLSDHIQNVIQKYLRNAYPDIDAYNTDAGEIAEAYRLLAVLNFPQNFSAASAKRLVSIAKNGGRCGVYTLVQVDDAKPLPYGFQMADLEAYAVVVRRDTAGRYVNRAGVVLDLDTPPTGVWAKDALTRIAKASKAASKVEVPFAKMLTMENLSDSASWWKTSSAQEITVPIGRTGANAVQTFSVGRGLAHHALLVGVPGSGKSNLLHVLITALATKYSPDEVQLYLIDFKAGVEFKTYAKNRLPHAKVVAIESEREFGLSVLRDLDAELARRGNLFRASGVSNVPEYRSQTGNLLPRVLLLVDEYQDFFTQGDALAQEVATLLENIVRKGRAFGVHICLASQTVAGAGIFSRSAIDQMTLRIALRCGENEFHALMGDGNNAAHLLTRPGEGIYNPASGAVQNNSVFQTAILENGEQEALLQTIRQKAGATASVPLIFEGHEMPPIERCAPLIKAIKERQFASSTSSVSTPPLYVGDPIAICPPVAVSLRRTSGAHLLVICNDETQVAGVVGIFTLSLAAQTTPLETAFAVADGLTNAPIAHLLAGLPHRPNKWKERDIAVNLVRLRDEVSDRVSKTKPSDRRILLLLAAAQTVRSLRISGGYVDDLSDDPPACLKVILRDGPDVGVHVVFHADTVKNAERCLDRAMWGDFGQRIGGVMSEDDSQTLFDSRVAALINRPNRLIFYNDAQAGQFEKFRPYQLPTPDFVQKRFV